MFLGITAAEWLSIAKTAGLVGLSAAISSIAAALGAYPHDAIPVVTTALSVLLKYVQKYNRPAAKAARQGRMS